jgi:hypothetical protein
MCRSRGPNDPRGGYAPREATRTVLYDTVAGALETFLAVSRERDRVVPRFVEREFRGFLECGILAHGFLRVHCDACRLDRLVPFSCKGRGFCPSCGGRRMADTAAHLADLVLPRVPVRQWVVTVPVALRYRMAFDARLTSDLLREFVRTLFAALRRRARRIRPIRRAHAGAVTFVQRFGDALNLNVHFHVLALDGVYDAGDSEAPRFVRLDAPDDAEILRVTRGFARRVARLLERRGLAAGSDDDGLDPLLRNEPLLAELSAASVRGRVASGPRAGERTRRLGDRVDVEHLEDDPPAGCASFAGISVHAAVAVPAGDRSRLERLCRYAARPALAGERLSRRDDGLLVYRLRHRWRDGTTHLLLEPRELVERLAVLVPPPRFHLVRYHGILAPAAGRRDRVVPAPPRRKVDGGASSRRDGDAAPPCERVPRGDDAPAPPPRRVPWADLLARVFAVDALRCPRCGETMRVLAAIQTPEAIRAILECLGLPTRPPPVAPPATGRLLPAEN